MGKECFLFIAIFYMNWRSVNDNQSTRLLSIKFGIPTRSTGIGAH
ncbi:Uncharacterised protein [Vibrio cholerae]|nr:Uncharacterised protein [Vibrio cholerae]